MTAKEKAHKLVHAFGRIIKEEHGSGNFIYSINKAKDCSLVCCEEILDYLEQDGYPPEYKFWIEVKQEIKQL